MKEKFKKVKGFILKNINWILLLAFVISFLKIMQEVVLGTEFVQDTAIYNFISENLISNVMTAIAKIITFFGGTSWFILLATFLLVVIKDKRIGITISLNLGAAALVNHTLKQMLQRPRPEGYRLIPENGFSFPSGHSMVSMAFYGFLIYLVYKKVKNKRTRNLLIILLSVLIVCIGFSRIYLGVHYPSDVLGGFLLALGYLVIYINFIKREVLKELY